MCGRGVRRTEQHTNIEEGIIEAVRYKVHNLIQYPLYLQDLHLLRHLLDSLLENFQESLCDEGLTNIQERVIVLVWDEPLHFIDLPPCLLGVHLLRYPIEFPLPFT